MYHADNATPHVRQMAQSFGFRKVSGRMVDAICDQRQAKRSQKATPKGLSCGAGTERKDNVCVPTAEACGDGTRLDNGVCVIDVHDHPCEEGTRWHIATGKCHVDCGIHGTWDADRRACVVDSGSAADAKVEK